MTRLTVRKKPLPTPFRRVAVSEVIQTLEGPVTAAPGDVVLTGVTGEEWPVARPKFESGYDVLQEGVCCKRPVLATATQMAQAFSVKVGWADEPIQGQAGDYLLTYGPGDFGVVRRDIFEQTYEVVGSG